MWLRGRPLRFALVGMGSKYRPSIKDQKATQRFHQNARRAAANGSVRKSLFLTAEPPRPAPRAPEAPPLRD